MSKLSNILAELQRIAGVAFRVFLVGVLLGLVLQFFNADGVRVLLGFDWIRKSWNLVGVALIGLIPLSIWLLQLVAKHSIQSGPVHEKDLAHYDYISDQAQTWGLLGTIVGIVMAGAALASRVSAGASSETIIEVIPMVAQALISTVVGLVLTAIAKSAYHVVNHVKGVRDVTEA